MIACSHLIDFYYLKVTHLIHRVGHNHTYIRIYDVYTVFLAGKLPYIRSYTVYIHGSGQPYSYAESHMQNVDFLIFNIHICHGVIDKMP